MGNISNNNNNNNSNRMEHNKIKGGVLFQRARIRSNMQVRRKRWWGRVEGERIHYWFNRTNF
jgi:hypothetical protein